MRKPFLFSLLLLILLVCSFFALVPKVYADGTFGSTVDEGTYYVIGTATMKGYLATCTESGTATKISVLLYVITAATDVKCVIYNNDKSLLAQTNVVTVPVQALTWTDFTFSTNPALTAANYWLCAFAAANNQVFMRYHTASGTGAYDGTCTYPTPSDPLVPGTNTWHMSIHCDYTTGGAVARSFQCNETLLPSAASYKNVGLGFQATNTIILYATGTMNKAVNFANYALLTFFSTATMNKAISFLAANILILLDNASATFQTSAAKWLNFTLGAILILFDSATFGKALQFQGTGILRLWDNVTMAKAVWISVFEIFNAVKLYASNILTATSATYNFWFLAFGLAVIGLISSAGLFVVFRRRQN